MTSPGSIAEATASTDGRTFRIDATGSPGYRPGDFVSLTEGDGVGLGLVEAAEVDGRGRLITSGRIYGAPASRVSGPGPAVVAPAEPELVESLLARSGAVLEVGRLASMPGVGAGLLPHRFNRHTFWCGQSGSGKTYALGVLLEELLMHTELPLIIFDPNADFVHLDQVDPEASGDRVDRLRGRDIRILRAAGQAGDDLLVRFTAMSVTAKAALLRLDPLIDRVEYNTLLHLEDMLAAQEPGQILPELRQSTDPEVRSFALRIENLGLLSWDMWAAGGRAATEIIDTRPAATVLDLGGFTTAEQPLVVALAVLDELWARRSERRPVLIVIDEAHNLCSPEAETPLQRMVLERIIQIAAEGQEVRALAPPVDPAALQGARRDHLPVRQPGADADELRARPRRARRDPELRAAGPARRVTVVPPGRGAVRRWVRARAEHRRDAPQAHRRGRTRRRGACGGLIPSPRIGSSSCTLRAGGPRGGARRPGPDRGPRGRRRSARRP